MDMRNTIYDKCLNMGCDHADDIDNDIVTLLDFERNKYVKRLDDLTKNIDDLKQELLVEKEKSNLSITIKKSEYLIRQYLNYKFRLLWNDLSQSTKDKFDKNMGNHIKRKHILDDDGVKYALLVLNNLCTNTSRDLCNYYLDLNNKFHPDFRPENIVVHQCIENLRQISPQYNNSILNEIDKLCLTK